MSVAQELLFNPRIWIDDTGPTDDSTPHANGLWNIVKAEGSTQMGAGDLSVSIQNITYPLVGLGFGLNFENKHKSLTICYRTSGQER